MINSFFNTNDDWNEFIAEVMKFRRARSYNSTVESTENHIHELLCGIEKGDYAAKDELGNLLSDSGDELCKMAADNGLSTAMFYYAVNMDMDGEKSESEKYYRMAAEQGEQRAMFNLARNYEHSERLGEAEKYYRMAADAGFDLARENLGKLLLKAGNEEEGIKLLEMLGESFTLARYFEKKGDNEQAEKYYRISLKDNDNDAGVMRVLGNFLMNCGREDEGLEYLLNSANQDNDDAQCRLAEYYRDKGDLDEAERFLRMAAEQGNKTAKKELKSLLKKKEKADGSGKSPESGKKSSKKSNPDFDEMRGPRKNYL